MDFLCGSYVTLAYQLTRQLLELFLHFPVSTKHSSDLAYAPFLDNWFSRNDNVAGNSLEPSLRFINFSVFFWLANYLSTRTKQRVMFPFFPWLPHSYTLLPGNTNYLLVLLRTIFRLFSLLWWPLHHPQWNRPKKHSLIHLLYDTPSFKGHLHG